MNKLVWILPVLVVLAAATLVFWYQVPVLPIQDDAVASISYPVGGRDLPAPLWVQLGCDPYVNHTCPDYKFTQEELDRIKVDSPKRYAVIIEYGGYRNTELQLRLDAMPSETAYNRFACGSGDYSTKRILKIPFVAAMNPDFTSWDDCWAVGMAFEERGYQAWLTWYWPDGSTPIAPPLAGKKDYDLDKYDSYSAWHLSRVQPDEGISGQSIEGITISGTISYTPYSAYGTSIDGGVPYVSVCLLDYGDADLILINKTNGEPACKPTDVNGMFTISDVNATDPSGDGTGIDIGMNVTLASKEASSR